MKTTLLTLCSLLLCGIVSMAQQADTALIPLKKGLHTKGKITYQGHTYTSDILEYDAPPAVVEKAIVDMMKSYGSKGEKKKGYLVYRNVHLSKVKKDGNVDAFALVEPKSKNEMDKTKLSLLFTEPGEIGDRKGEGKSGAAVATISLSAMGLAFADNMNTEVSSKHHEGQVDAKMGAITKMERDIKRMEADQADMKKKLERLQKNIADNDRALEKARQQLLEENKNLDQLKAKKLLGKD